MGNASVAFMNAKNLAFEENTFDIAISGFMGWYDCFDFVQNQFTKPDQKIKEIWRTLKDGGRLVCCSWHKQEDLRWMEATFVRHYPAILDDDEYLRRRPIGMAYEKAQGYQIILRSAGFKEIESVQEEMVFISTDEEEWWRQMAYVGWASLFEKVEARQLESVRQAIFDELQPYKQEEGIYFAKQVFFVSGVK